MIQSPLNAKGGNEHGTARHFQACAATPEKHKRPATSSIKWEAMSIGKTMGIPSVC